MTTPLPDPSLDASSPRRAAAPRPVLWRIISVLVVLVVTPLAIGMMLAGTTASIRAFSRVGEPSLAGTVLVLVGAALISGVACTAFWSSLGVAIEGALILLGGVVAVLIPAQMLFAVASTAGSAESQTLIQWSLSGAPVVLGGLFLVIGGVASVARRRTTRGAAVPLVR